MNTKIDVLQGLSAIKTKMLQDELGIFTFKDLLFSFPFRYVDKTKIYEIRELGKDEDYVQIHAEVISKKLVKGKRATRLVVIVQDQSGKLELVWFQGAQWVGKGLIVGEQYIFYGKLNFFNGKLNITHPDYHSSKTQKQIKTSLDPIYSSTEKLNKKGLQSKQRKKLIQEVFQKLSKKDFIESFSSSYLEELKLIDIETALKWIHLPQNVNQKETATKRLKFEELFFLQLGILFQKSIRQSKIKGYKFSEVGKKFHSFFEKLPFELTTAQKKVVKEIRKDLGSGIQMNRLLQGDVGSGKTIVALLSILIALDNGYQACIMAPTEILARQHFDSIQGDLKGSGIQVAFLSGSVKGKRRAQTLQLLKEGLIHLLIGTHALIEEPVQYLKLGLAVIDEQHRFGVAQRAKLWKKSGDAIPHILVMTATPIPRTMAQTVYGDLDTSVIDELPPGRKAIKTIHQYDSKRPELNQFIEREITKGRQVYIVYPIIEESETLDLENLQQGYEKLLHRFPRPDYQISIVHGRMHPNEKNAEMQRFLKKETQIMVATTVIEVGVNVPNASVMVIENAERFGLSQLHQLRGRVGRGAEQSFCVLLSSYKLSKDAKERLSTMVRTNDGFEIAEVDLRLRGPGDVEGTQQSGILDLKISNIVRDQELLHYARHFAINILQEDPTLQLPKNQPFYNKLKRDNKINMQWGRIS